MLDLKQEHKDEFIKKVTGMAESVGLKASARFYLCLPSCLQSLGHHHCVKCISCKLCRINSHAFLFVF